MKTEVNNSKLFRKIVREHNEKTGFNFVLPKDTDFADEYAHPVHDDGVMKITSQIDDSNKSMYALTVKIGAGSFRIEDSTTYTELKAVIATEDFKYRLGSLEQLRNLGSELQDSINHLEHNVLTTTIDKMKKDEIYDQTLRVAKALYKETQ